jgi:8-oxo-dGTP pyrophosphatase MutT (NUDIX family)
MTNQECVRAAAICYRKDREGFQFYLVQTMNRRHWTFPKGRIEAGESPRDAALREAQEEAGITGRVLADSVGEQSLSYRYPGGRRCQHVDVEAFLVEVEKIGDQAPVDRHRERDWFDHATAKEKLAENREDEYVRELHRVTDEAVRILKRESD